MRLREDEQIPKEARLTPEDKELKLKFIYEWCKRCGICIEFCPVKAIDEKPDGSPYLDDPGKCVLCGTCWLMCPDMAIVNPNIEDEESNDE